MTSSADQATSPRVGAVSEVPLVVDLDGTLTPVDTLHEGAVGLFAGAPLRTLLQLPSWLAQGKAHLKREIALRHSIDPARLPWSEEVLSSINDAKSQGRKVVLCTASDRDTAERVAQHLGVFDQVLASDGIINLSGQAKVDALVDAFGEGGFDYIGNASPDVVVWSKSRRALVVSNDEKLISRARDVAQVCAILPAPRPTAQVWAKQLRLHQWAKNVLLFVPLIASQKILELLLFWQVAMAFFVFGLVASATYVMNDLFDLKADRLHAQKRNRPLAAGVIPTGHAVGAVVLGLVAGLLLAWAIGVNFLLVTLAYLVATITYSFVLKQIVLIDCVWLAGLFTLRVVVGAVVIESIPSYWLLMFSVFLFLSLAYLKRYIELRGKPRKQKIEGRGYMAEDMPVVFALGVGAGYAATVVLSLYLFSPQALALYGNPYAIVVAVPVIIYWLSYMWLRAHRGEMHHDPVLFALRDRTSFVTVALFFAIFFLGAVLPH